MLDQAKKPLSSTGVALLKGGPHHRERREIKVKSSGATPIKLTVGDSIYIRRTPAVAGVGEYEYAHTVEEDQALKYQGRKQFRIHERRLDRDPVVVKDQPPILGVLTCSCCEDGSPCSGYGI